MRIKAPEATYAIFSYAGHISEIRSVFRAILGEWLPASGRQHANAPTLERYGAAFDPMTGNGGYEIWIPLKS